MTNIWLYPVNGREDLVAISACLPHSYVAPADKYQVAQTHRESLLAHALLCFALGDMAPALCHTEMGKPYLKDSPLCVSISHGGGYVACAVSDNACGVDVEAVCPEKDRTALAKRLFSEREAKEIKAAADGAFAFAAVWTAHEAYSKQRGGALADTFGHTVRADFTAPLTGAFLSACGSAPFALHRMQTLTAQDNTLIFT